MTESKTALQSAPIARLTGLAYLGIITTGLFAEVGVRMSLVHAAEPATTMANIAQSASLFRAGIAADAIMIALDVAVAVGFYALLRDFSRPLALLAAALRIVQAAVLGANLMNMASALRWATSGSAAANPELSQTMVQASMELHRVVYDLGLIFFGLSCLVLGHLVRSSRVMPRLLGAGLSVAGGVYLLGSFAVVLTPQFAATLDPLYGLTVIAELSVAGWLAAKGVAASAPVRSEGSPSTEALATLLATCGPEHAARPRS